MTQISSDIWIVTTEKEKYLGMIRYFIPNRYVAVIDGKVFDDEPELMKAVKHFET